MSKVLMDVLSIAIKKYLDEVGDHQTACMRESLLINSAISMTKWMVKKPESMAIVEKHEREIQDQIINEFHPDFEIPEMHTGILEAEYRLKINNHFNELLNVINDENLIKGIMDREPEVDKKKLVEQ